MKKMYILVGLIMCVILFYVTWNTIGVDTVADYKLKENEKVIEEYKYNDFKYLLTSYHNKNETHASNNLLLEYNEKYYLLEDINQCDMSYFIKDDNIFIHCIGKEGSIIKYNLNRNEVKEEIINFDYSETPNISQIHITIENVDDNNIYLKSAVKNKDSIKEGEKVVCSFSSEKCKYEE